MPPQLDEMFDLDLALTIPRDSNTERNDAQVTAVARHMPTVIVGGGNLCAVCMEPLRSEGKQVQCGHVFHENCISQWLLICDSCPLCRSKVSDVGEITL